MDTPRHSPSLLIQSALSSTGTSSVGRKSESSEGSYDDLKLIYGVGPVLEEMLHKLGIYWFREVAAWSEAEIDRIDAQLEKFHGRIRREDWVTSAKDEHLKKYGEQL